MRDKTEILECETYAMSFAVLRISEMLANEYLGREFPISIRVEAGPAKGWDDVVETWTDNCRTHWQVKRQSTPLARAAILELLTVLHQNTQIRKGTLVLRAAVKVIDVSETRIYERIHERSARVCEPQDRAYLANDIHKIEEPWLDLLKTAVITSDATINEPYASIAAIELAGRFEIHIAGTVIQIRDSAEKNLAHIIENNPSMGFMCLHSTLHLGPDASIGHRVESIRQQFQREFEWRPPFPPPTRPGGTAQVSVPRSVWLKNTNHFMFLGAKPLWSSEGPVNVEELYYPVPVKHKDGRIAAPSTSTLLKPCQRTVVVGGPGSGKSTLLKHLWLTEYRSQERVPIFIETRSLQGKSIRLACRERLSEFGLPVHDDGGPESDLITIFRSGSAVLVVDGFDELGANREEEVRAQLETLCCLAPSMPIVVSTRPHSAISESVYFDTVELLAMTSDDIRGYIHHATNRGKLDSRANGIWETVTDKIQGVLSTPLLLDLYISAQQHSSDPAPTSKLGLYRKMFELLYINHDRSKGHMRKSAHNIHWRDIRVIFSRLCLMTCNSGPLQDSIKVERYTSQILGEIGHHSIRPVDILEDISIRTGLIIQHDEGYEFVHREMQDCYAAFAVVDSGPDDFERLAYYMICDRERGPAHSAINFLRSMSAKIFRAYIQLPWWRIALRHIDDHNLSGTAAAISIFASDLFFIHLQDNSFEWRNNGCGPFHYCYDEWVQQYSVYSQVMMFAPGEDESALVSKSVIGDHWPESFLTLDGKCAITNLGKLYQVGAVSRALAQRYCDMLDVIRMRVDEIEKEVRVSPIISFRE